MNKLGIKASIIFISKYILLSLVLWFLLFIFLAVVDARDSLILFSFIFFLFLGGLWGWLFYKSYVYSLDEKGITVEKGVINKHKVVIPYRNIQNIDMPRTLIDRILGLSHIKIQTAADVEDYEGIIPNLDKVVAKELQERILKLINQ